MGCNRDGNCLNIARKIYPELQSEIDSNITAINTEIVDTVEELNALNIPDDYLGEKVEKRLKEICESFNNDLDELNANKNSIDTFISEKISVHENHYRDWQKAQELKRKKLLEEENVNYTV